MFQSNVPRQIIQKIKLEINSNNSDIRQIYVVCSGSFRVERSLYTNQLGIPTISNDVSLYTTMLGDYFAGQDNRKIELSETAQDDFGFITGDCIETPLARAGTALCLNNIVNYLYPENLFERRIFEAYTSKWSEHYNATTDRLKTSKFRIAEYHCEEACKFISRLPDSGAVCLVLPPIHNRGYKQSFKNFDSLFVWDEPEKTSDQTIIESVSGGIKNNRVLLVEEKKLEQLPSCGNAAEIYRYIPLSKNPVYLYSSVPSAMSLSQDKIKVEKLSRKLYTKSEIPIGAVLEIAKLSIGEFNLLRALYLNKGIEQHDPSYCFAVCVDGAIIGAVGIGTSHTYIQDHYFDISPYFYILSDFAINSTIKKLSKLIVIATLSREMQTIIQSLTGVLCRNVITNIFTRSDTSMKYRGLLVKYSIITDEDDHNVKRGINYVGAAGRWTLDEGLTYWREIVQRGGK